jgi:rubredoxin
MEAKYRRWVAAGSPLGLSCNASLYPILSHPNLMTEKQEFKTWMCLICGFIYSETEGLPEEGIPAGTRWEDVPMNWTCPECGARKEDFEMVQL